MCEQSEHDQETRDWAEHQINQLAASLAEGDRPSKAHFARGLRDAAAYEIALPAVVLEHVAKLLDHKLGHDKSRVCRRFATPKQVFSKIQPQSARCLRVTQRYEELRAIGHTQKESYELLRDEFSSEFLARKGKDESRVSDRALARDIQKGRAVLTAK